MPSPKIGESEVNPKRHEGHKREIPHSHIYHAILPIIFIVVWFLDTQIFQISTILNDFIPFLIRLILAIIILIIAIIFIQLSHRALFKSHQPPDTLIKRGILGRSRNPMYFGILLIYTSFLCFSISIIAIGIFIVIFFIYNWMVNYEEKILENLFGVEFLDYKKKVPKWIPNPFRKYKT